MKQYIQVELVTEQEKVEMQFPEEGLIVMQIDADKGLWQMTNNVWEYIGGRPPRR